MAAEFPSAPASEFTDEGQPETSARRRRPTRAETRARVLDAAATVFAERGIAATSLNEVAAHAGLTKGAVYSSFAGKDELVLAIMEEHLVERMHEATAAFEELSDIEAAADEAGMRLLNRVQNDATWHRLFLEYWGLAMRDPVIHAGLAQRRKQLHDALAGAIRKQAERLGATLALPPQHFAVAMLALSNGLAVERGIDDTAVPDSLFGEILRQLVGGSMPVTPEPRKEE